ncbi:m7GpppN-mRNA hydrolase [Frankliniella fusca]|uniref:m7GpppN-mRNA hydrolase n=1 Tax=Frankliniella fusca TaxID=407009 RepID=A0AAE1L7J3_9NEOP|nr:m7GpppN-mRNA hydrolase [Frankliniella fusca]
MTSKVDCRGEEKIPVDILYDLISRFIINIPEDERKNMVRICFQIEIAHWFYLDFYCTEENPHLKTCTMKEFTTLILKHIPDLRHHLKNVDSILTEWREYKRAVPTYGAIVLDEDLSHVLLVQSFMAKSSWGFPKGKVNEEEPPVRCAVREVFEETGFDISGLIDDKEFIEITWNEQVTRLYLIPGVDRATVFRPRTRMEIKAVEWFPLADLPTDRKKNTKDATPKTRKGPTNPNNFFMVLPFVKKIRQWVNQKQPRRQRHKSVTDADMLGRQHRKSTSESSDNHPKQLTQQQMFAVSLQADILENNLLRQQRAVSTGPLHTPLSAPPRAQMQTRRDKASIKRQLFTGDEDKNGLVPRSQQNGRTKNGMTPRQNGTTPFSARAWNNFKFDRALIYAAILSPLRTTGVVAVS